MHKILTIKNITLILNNQVIYKINLFWTKQSYKKILIKQSFNYISSINYTILKI